MTATVEQIVEEAYRRAERHRLQFGGERQNTRFLIEVVRENWTPPEPVADPDILAFREWETRVGCSDAYRKAVLEGKWDHSVNARAFLAGARMAREQERERAKPIAEYVKKRRYDDGEAYHILAKYRGEA